MEQPAADVVIDESVVRSLLSEQHADLAGLPLEWAATGWDNDLWRLGHELVVRLPRRREAVPLTAHEVRWLPSLAARLPLPTSAPIRIGEPSQHFPRPWFVARWIDGEPGDRSPITDGVAGAAALAGFLRALHTEAPAEAPFNRFRGSVPVGDRTDTFESLLGSVGWRIDAERVRALWDDAVSAPAWDGPRLWLHGDLHPANTVVAGGTLVGVVDFGDLCAGDPASDLAAAWMQLPGDSIPRFLTSYGGVDDATLRRARGWATLFGLMLLDIGQAGERGRPGGKVAWGAVGRRTLERLLVPAADPGAPAGDTGA